MLCSLIGSASAICSTKELSNQIYDICSGMTKKYNSTIKENRQLNVITEKKASGDPTRSKYKSISEDLRQISLEIPAVITISLEAIRLCECKKQGSESEDLSYCEREGGCIDKAS